MQAGFVLNDFCMNSPIGSGRPIAGSGRAGPACAGSGQVEPIGGNRHIYAQVAANISTHRWQPAYLHISGMRNIHTVKILLHKCWATFG